MELKSQIAPSVWALFENVCVIEQTQTEYHVVAVIESPYFGRMLVINGVIQFTERDGHVYHEMLVHPAATTAEDLRRVLIIGGGDGFAAAECLRYSVESITIVDIDPAVPMLAR